MGGAKQRSAASVAHKWLLLLFPWAGASVRSTAREVPLSSGSEKVSMQPPRSVENLQADDLALTEVLVDDALRAGRTTGRRAWNRVAARHEGFFRQVDVGSIALRVVADSHGAIVADSGGAEVPGSAAAMALRRCFVATS